MDWIEVTVNSSHAELDSVGEALTAAGIPGFITEDEADVESFLEGNKKYWDYVDEGFMASIRGVSRIKFYLEDSEEGRRELRRVSALFPDRELLTRRCRDEDWENNWKEYYKPIPVGDRLLIVPEWESADAGDRIALRLDPGLIFGTGAHDTTQMCLRALERVSAPGKTVLDLGCGSGILAIAALLLGCGKAVGVDIDEKAPKVVMENAALNRIGPDRLTAFAGDVLRENDLSRRLRAEKFDIITANIVADVIIAIAPRVPEFMAEGAKFICSGIIEGREPEVEAALRGAGLEIIEHMSTPGGWNAYVCE